MLEQYIDAHGWAFHTAVISTSLLARGIVIALSHFNPHIRAFRPDAIDAAFTHLKVSGAERPVLWAEVTRLREHLDLAPLVA
jgi:hypothetical protein